jgi:hypothetical protein
VAGAVAEVTAAEWFATVPDWARTLAIVVFGLTAGGLVLWNVFRVERRKK